MDGKEEYASKQQLFFFQKYFLALQNILFKFLGVLNIFSNDDELFDRGVQYYSK